MMSHRLARRLRHWKSQAEKMAHKQDEHEDRWYRISAMSSLSEGLYCKAPELDGQYNRLCDREIAVNLASIRLQKRLGQW